MKVSVGLRKFVENWAVNKQQKSRKMLLHLGEECLVAAEVLASGDNGKYTLTLVMPAKVEDVEDALEGVVVQFSGVKLKEALADASVEDSMLTVEVDIEEKTVILSFEGGSVVEGVLVKEIPNLALPSHNEEHDVRYDEEKKVFSFAEAKQGVTVICNTLDAFSVRELQEIRSKFDKPNVVIPEDNSEKYSESKADNKAASVDPKVQKRRERSAAAAVKFKEATSLLNDDDDDDDDDETVTEGEGGAPEPEAPEAPDAPEAPEAKAPEANDEIVEEISEAPEAKAPEAKAPEAKAPDAPEALEAGAKVTKKRASKEEAQAAKVAKAKELLEKGGFVLGEPVKIETIQDLARAITGKLSEIAALLDTLPAAEERAPLNREELLVALKDMIKSGEITLKDLVS